MRINLRKKSMFTIDSMEFNIISIFYQFEFRENEKQKKKTILTTITANKPTQFKYLWDIKRYFATKYFQNLDIFFLLAEIKSEKELTLLMYSATGIQKIQVESKLK